eukprot:8615612-Alexandrium_andersonii.AAC.1
MPPGGGGSSPEGRGRGPISPRGRSSPSLREEAADLAATRRCRDGPRRRCLRHGALQKNWASDVCGAPLPNRRAASPPGGGRTT